MRYGVCEPQGCGSACCKDMWLEIAPVTLDQRRWLALHNVGITDMDGRQFAHIEIKCSQLTEDGRCNCYGTSIRPQMCADFPEHVGQLELSNLKDVCSYTFTEDTIPLEVVHAR